MRKSVVLGLVIWGTVLIALSLSGTLPPNTSCDDTPPAPFVRHALACAAPFPLVQVLALGSGIVLVLAGLVAKIR